MKEPALVKPMSIDTQGKPQVRARAYKLGEKERAASKGAINSQVDGGIV